MHWIYAWYIHTKYYIILYIQKRKKKTCKKKNRWIFDINTTLIIVLKEVIVIFNAVLKKMKLPQAVGRRTLYYNHHEPTNRPTTPTFCWVGG